MFEFISNYFNERAEKTRIRRNEEVLKKLQTDEEFCKLCVAHAIKADKLAGEGLTTEDLDKIDRMWLRYNWLKKDIEYYEERAKEYEEKANKETKQKYADEYLLEAKVCKRHVEKLSDYMHHNYTWCVEELEQQMQAEGKTPLEILDEKMRLNPVQSVPNIEVMRLKAEATKERRRKRITAGEATKRRLEAKGRKMAEVAKKKEEKERKALAKHAKFLINAKIEEIRNTWTPTYFIRQGLRDKKIAGLKSIIKGIDSGMLKSDFTLQEIIKIKREAFKELDIDGYFKKSSTKGLLDDLIELEKELHKDQEKFVNNEVLPFFGIREKSIGG